MSLRNLRPASDSADWDRAWEDIFDHYQQDLRHAYYVRALLAREERRLLEIGAGSFRDMAALHRVGFDCTGIDFSAEAVTRAKTAFPQIADRMHTMSAFEMGFPDDAFDLTYHNGFWVLFDDERIQDLAREQARVSRRRMIATVHNKHNQQFVEYFDKMRQTDPIYDIRFFESDEVASLMLSVCNDVRVVPVGKGKRRHEDVLIRHGLTHPALIRTYLELSGNRLLSQSERLLCIGVLS